MVQAKSRYANISYSPTSNYPLTYAQAHPFFHSIDWRKLLDRKYEPSFKPSVLDERDTANFDKEFTSEAPTDSYVDGPMLSQTMQQQFAGWSYNRPVEGLGDAGGSIVQGNAFNQR